MTWLMLVYRLPSDSSTRRVYIWRRLKRIGAVYLQDGTCVLPASERTREQLQWLAAETVEVGGEAYVLTSEFHSRDQEERVIEQFRDQSRSMYKQMLENLQNPARQTQDEVDAVFREAWAAYGFARQVDFFNVHEGEEALKKLRANARQMAHGHGGVE